MTRRLQLAQLLGLAFAILLAASLVIGAFTAGSWHREDRARDQQRFLQLKVDQFARTVAEAVDSRLKILALISGRPSVTGAQRDPAAARDLLDTIGRNFPEFVWIGITDLDGRIVASTAGVLTGQSAAKRDWFGAGQQAAFVGGVHDAILLKDHVRRRADGEPARLMDMAVPIHDAGGRLVGVLAAHLDDIWLDSIRELAAQTSTEGQRFRLVLTEARGEPIATDPDKDALAGEELLTAVGTMPADSGAAKLGWQARASLPLAELDAEVRRFRQRALLAGLAAALICVPLILFLSHRLARPIAALSAQVHAARRGQPEGGPVAIPVGGTRETARLGLEVRGLLHEVQQQRELLTANEARLRALLEAAPDAIVSVAASGRIVLANPAAEQMFGWPQAELIGRPLNDLIPARLHQRHDRHMQGFAASDRPAGAMGRATDLVACRADGSEFPIEASIFRTEAGGERRMTAIVRDITERQRTDAELRASAARYRHLFYDHPVAMWVYDVETLAFLEVNEVAVARYGWSRDEFLRMSILDIRPDEEVERVRDSARRLDGSQTFWSSGPWTHVTRDGTRLKVMIQGHALTWNDRQARLVVAHDVTRMIEAQDELRRKQEELSALSRELITKEASERAALAQILHDRFAQNLVAARLTVEMVNQQLRSAGSETADSAVRGLGSVLELLGEAIRDVRGLLNDLRPPLLDDFGLRAALQFEIDRRRAGSAAALSFSADSGDDLPGPEGERRVDRSVEYALFMIVREAVHNAVMHAQARRIDVHLEIGDDEVSATVTDDGVGFEPIGGAERIGHLGLVGMQERARTVGARLLIDSAPGGGTRIGLHWAAAGDAADRLCAVEAKG